jgi:drug/metabolite transporter (DMT)-like permease
VFILTLQPVLAKTQTCQQKSQTVQNVVMNLPTARKDRLDALAMTILLACCVFWGFQQVMVKATLPEVPSVLQAGIRFSGATLVLLVWARWRGIRFGGGLPLATHLVPGLAAGLLFFGEFAFLQLAIRDIPASRLTVLLYTSPFWVAVCLPVFVKSERLGRWQWLGLGIAFGAVAFALRESLQLATSHWGGDLLALAAGASWGFTTVVIRSTPLGHTGAPTLLLYQVAVSGPLLLAMSWALGEPWKFQWGAWAWFSLAVQSAIGAFASFLIWMWLLGRYPATLLSSFVFLTPISALLTGVLWLNEVPTSGLVVSLTGVILGIVMVNQCKR